MGEQALRSAFAGGEGTFALLQLDLQFTFVAVHVQHVFWARGDVRLDAFGLVIHAGRGCDSYLQLVLARRQLQLCGLVH